jgi:hypothetical protein
LVPGVKSKLINPSIVPSNLSAQPLKLLVRLLFEQEPKATDEQLFVCIEKLDTPLRNISSMEVSKSPLCCPNSSVKDSSVVDPSLRPQEEKKEINNTEKKILSEIVI